MKKLFILGNPRSGTSLFRLMLNAHPDIASPPECGFLHWWYTKYKNWSVKNNNSRDIKAFAEDVLSSKKIETWTLDESELINYINRKQPGNYENLIEAVYLFWSEKNNKSPKVIIDKNNYYIHHLEDLNSIWPNANYLFLIRDGRDVACSYLDMQQLKTDSPYKPKLASKISDIAQEWNDNNLRIERFLHSLGNNRWQCIKFEELVGETEKTLQKVCHFLGLEFNQEMLYYYEKNKNKGDEPLSTLDWKKKTLEKPDAKSIDRYKALLLDIDVNIFNSNAKEALVRFGYIH